MKKNPNKRLTPGYSYRYKRPAVSNDVIHILAIIGRQIVYKWYSRIRQSWQYQIESNYYLQDLLDDNRIIQIGRSKKAHDVIYVSKPAMVV